MLAAKKIHAAILSKRRDKEEEDGVATMCKMMEDMRKEALNDISAVLLQNQQ